ncbi:LLM class flavin-dependent oxidoreductase [Actinoplanes sp. NPDC049118]|uniref:LLM class flavin-dependent oxidoreductase n=1 Tax=Actinoplanes sp. NPDC049118 TaxID=3155769 RepID=UPI0033F5D45A
MSNGLARAHALLDRLTGGRIELAIGAGAFWDGIEAMGGRRLTAGRSVDALGEAIEVIRQVWDADRPGPRLASRGGRRQTRPGTGERAGRRRQ